MSSLPPREAWIEIKTMTAKQISKSSRFPRGKRGLKSFFGDFGGIVNHRRFPRGKRGLKYSYGCRLHCHWKVASPAGSVD